MQSQFMDTTSSHWDQLEESGYPPSPTNHGAFSVFFFHLSFLLDSRKLEIEPANDIRLRRCRLPEINPSVPEVVSVSHALKAFARTKNQKFFPSAEPQRFAIAPPQRKDHSKNHRPLQPLPLRRDRPQGYLPWRKLSPRTSVPTSWVSVLPSNLTKTTAGTSTPRPEKSRPPTKSQRKPLQEKPKAKTSSAKISVAPNRSLDCSPRDRKISWKAPRPFRLLRRISRRNCVRTFSSRLDQRLRVDV